MKMIDLIRYSLVPRSEEELQFMVDFTQKFDFLQTQQSEGGMAKDQKSVYQMCKVMKYMFIGKDSMVFDYESQGDLFYMVINGKVSCKVPFYKQLILMSEDEINLYKLEFGEDILQVSEAEDINK
jgi:hypothetical protein